MNPLEELESNVRYYCRRWPAVVSTAHNSTTTAEGGTQHLDFFAGPGALSYGLNNPILVEVATEQLRAGKILHILDTHTVEKRRLVVETCGAGDSTVKSLPPIVIDEDQWADGLARLSDAVRSASSLR